MYEVNAGDKVYPFQRTLKGKQVALQTSSQAVKAMENGQNFMFVQSVPKSNGLLYVLTASPELDQVGDVFHRQDFNTLQESFDKLPSTNREQVKETLGDIAEDLSVLSEILHKAPAHDVEKMIGESGRKLLQLANDIHTHSNKRGDHFLPIDEEA